MTMTFAISATSNTGEGKLYRFYPQIGAGGLTPENDARATETADEPFLSQSELLQLADRCPPPQRWYDEDFAGLF